MENLIKALQIFLKYGNPANPTHCEHDTLWICGYDWEENPMSEEDQNALDELGFFYSESDNHWQSYRYGSA